MRHCPIVNEPLTEDECAETMLGLGLDMAVAHCRHCSQVELTPAAAAGPDGRLSLDFGRELLACLKTSHGLSLAVLARECGQEYAPLYQALHGYRRLTRPMAEAMASALRGLGEDVLADALAAAGARR